MNRESEWQHVPLSKAGKWLSGGTPSTGNPDYWSGAIPWISSGSLTSFNITDSDRRITELGAQNGTRIVEPNTILMVVRGMSLKSEFRMGIARRPVAFGQDCKALVADLSFDPEFLAYAISALTPTVLAIVDEAGHGTGRLNSDQLFALEVPRPLIAEQRAIAEVLGALDDKIAANRKVIAVSTELAATELWQACTEGSRDTTVGDIANFHNRRRVPLSSRQRDERRGTVPYYGAAGPIDTVDEAIFDDRLVLVGEDGTVTTDSGKPYVQYIWGPSWVNNHAHVLTGNGLSTELLRHVIAGVRITDSVTGAVQPKLSMGNLKAVAVRVPTGERLARLDQQIDALAAVERSHIDENEKLATTRDGLLPLLMSGKLRVKDAEKQIGEVV